MSRTFRRLVGSAVLLGWLAPGALAFAGVLLLATRDVGAGHVDGLADLARSASHGHHHDEEATPEHDHEATFDGRGAETRPVSTGAAVTIAGLQPLVACAEGVRVQPASWRGPPASLFRTHCALLL